MSDLLVFSGTIKETRIAKKYMSREVKINLPDEIYQRIQNLSQAAERDISEVLTHTLKLFLPLLDLGTKFASPVSTLSDEEVLSLTELQMEHEQDERLSNLLNKQQEAVLSEMETVELQTLMQIYSAGLLRKATALSEAVKRGLIQPLT